MARQAVLRTLPLLLLALLLTACCAAHDTQARLPAAAARRALLADAAASGSGGNSTASHAAEHAAAVEEVAVVRAVAQQQAYDNAFCRSQSNRAGMSGLFVGGASSRLRRSAAGQASLVLPVLGTASRCFLYALTPAAVPRHAALMGGCAVYCVVAARHSGGSHGHGGGEGPNAAPALDADDLKQRLTRLKALQAATSA